MNTQPSADRPNILLIFPDQWRGDCLSYLGNPDVETPNLDELCCHGVTFTRAYTPATSCIAARASLITGQTPSTTGRLGYRDGVPWEFQETMMATLRDAGYETINVGKTHFFPDRAGLGFETNHLFANEQHAKQFDPSFVSDYHEWLRAQTGGTVKESTQMMHSNGWQVRTWTYDEHLHPNHWTTQTAIDALTERDTSRPFFLQLGYHRPHPPLDPPQRYFDLYKDRKLRDVPIGDWAAEFDVPVVGTSYAQGHLADHLLDRTRKAYLAQVMALDFEIGRMFLFLRQQKLYQNTIILFASDHGEMLGDHHHFRKTVPFEGSAKIPFILKPHADAGAQAGVMCGTPITLVDVMPTLLELTGTPIPGHVEGTSIVPIVRGEAERIHDWVHGEHAPCWQWIVDDRYKYAWKSDSGEEWLFDLVDDPQELTNLAAAQSHAATVEECRARLVSVLEKRPEDGLAANGALVVGKALPPVR